MKKLLGVFVFLLLCGGFAFADHCDFEHSILDSNTPCGLIDNPIDDTELTDEEKELAKYKKCTDSCIPNNPGDDGADYCACKCDGGVTLNTSVPFIGRCILLGNKNASGPNSTEVTQLSAFPRLMKALTNIALSLILVTSLIMIIAGGVMIASSGANSGGYDQGKKMIRKVIIGLVLLGASGIILALINPNFFG